MATETQTPVVPANGAPPVVQAPVVPPVKVEPVVETPKVEAPKVETPKVDDAALSLGDKKPDAPKVDEKPAEVKASALKLPEGLTAEDPAVKALVELAGKNKIPTEAQQALLDQHLALGKARDAELAAAFKAERGEWLKASKADPTLGAGSEKTWGEVVATSRRALVAFGDPELMQFLESTNGVNHPAMVRFVNKVGKALGEDNALETTKGATPVAAVSPEASLQARYPTMYPKKS